MVHEANHLIKMSSDDWLCWKVEKLNLTFAEGYPTCSTDTIGLSKDQFVKVPHTQRWYDVYIVIAKAEEKIAHHHDKRYSGGFHMKSDWYHPYSQALETSKKSGPPLWKTLGPRGQVEARPSTTHHDRNVCGPLSYFKMWTVLLSIMYLLSPGCHREKDKSPNVK